MWTAVVAVIVMVALVNAQQQQPPRLLSAQPIQSNQGNQQRATNPNQPQRQPQPQQPQRQPQQNGGGVDGNQRMGLRIVKHFPCKSPTWNATIVYANYTTAPLLPDPDEVGCYSINGPYTVRKSIRGNLQMYTEFVDSPNNNALPQPCTEYDNATGCGGLGSCVYCSGCNTLKSSQRLAGVKLTFKDQQIACNQEKLDPGIYNNVKMTFCMPSKKKFSEVSGMDERFLDDLSSAKGGKNRLGIFLTLYTFAEGDIDVAQLGKQQYQAMARLKKLNEDTAARQNNGDPPERISQAQYDAMPLRRAVLEQKYVACHRVFGHLFLDAKSAAQSDSNGE